MAGLLIGLRQLSVAGVPGRQLRPPRILLAVCGVAELALNIAGPLAAGAYGRAAFDAAGPLLLVGWAETGPGLLRCLYATPLRQPMPGSEAAHAARVDEGDTVRAGTAHEARVAPDGGGTSNTRRRHRSSVPQKPRLDDLLTQALRVDQEHRLRHGRPVAAETLRKQMRIGSMRARALVQRVRQAQEADGGPHFPDRHGPGPVHSSGKRHPAPAHPAERAVPA